MTAAKGQVARSLSVPGRAARRFALVVLALCAVPGGYILQRNVKFVWGWLQSTTPAEPDGYLEKALPGFNATVAWVRNAGMERIHSLPYDSDPFVYQRLIELLYPEELVPTEEDKLTPGTLVVMKADVKLVRASELVIRCGALKIMRVK